MFLAHMHVDSVSELLSSYRLNPEEMQNRGFPITRSRSTIDPLLNMFEVFAEIFLLGNASINNLRKKITVEMFDWKSHCSGKHENI